MVLVTPQLPQTDFDYTTGAIYNRLLIDFSCLQGKSLTSYTSPQFKMTSQVNIGLAKKFVWVLLWKPEKNFLANPVLS